MRFTMLLPLLPLLASPVHPQEKTPEQQAEEARREKIEAILRIQDLRTPHDGQLIRLTSDPDPLVRRQAFLAYGSIQDTSAIPLLVGALTDRNPAVQSAAAFAIGQTGTMLGETRRQKLEDELLWTWVRETAAAEELIDGIGKWGTVAALRQLLVTIGNTHPPLYPKGLQMAIARFAIRGIILDEGVEYLTRFLRPAEGVPWEIMYALQKIGRHPRIEAESAQLVRVAEHRDPLVRLNLAILLGKMEEKGATLPLLRRLARFDADWRVRVNAIRSLGMNQPLRDISSISVIREASLDRNPNVSVSALGAIGEKGDGADSTSDEYRQFIETVEDIAYNQSGDFHWHQQSEAVSLLATLTGEGALKACQVSTPYPLLRGGLLRAAGKTGSTLALPLLAEAVGDETPAVVCGALEGLKTLALAKQGDTLLLRRLHALVLQGLESRDVAVVSTAAGALREGPLLRFTDAAPLLARLADLRVPDDIEAYQEICATLAVVGDRTAAVPALLGLLSSPDPSVGKAAADALRSITGADYRGRIPSRAEPLHLDLDFRYLRSLPPTVRVQLETARGSIQIDLDRDAAPFTVMTILKLAKEKGFYRGVTFHRVVPNFVIQGGDPRGDGWGGPGFTIRSEFSPLRFGTGTVGIASAGKDTEGSQFFITHSPQPHLDGRYTVIGQVVAGQGVVDEITVDDRIHDLTVIGE